MFYAIVFERQFQSLLCCHSLTINNFQQETNFLNNRQNFVLLEFNNFLMKLILKLYNSFPLTNYFSSNPHISVIDENNYIGSAEKL